MFTASNGTTHASVCLGLKTTTRECIAIRQATPFLFALLKDYVWLYLATVITAGMTFRIEMNDKSSVMRLTVSGRV